MQISNEFKEWLLAREKHLEAMKRMREAGGHMMLRGNRFDPEELEEPLKSEALKYFAELKAQS